LPESEKGAVIEMLPTKTGARVDEIASAAGWPRHDVRGLFEHRPAVPTPLACEGCRPSSFEEFEL
jgi:hypothetical protein